MPSQMVRIAPTAALNAPATTPSLPIQSASFWNTGLTPFSQTAPMMLFTPFHTVSTADLNPVNALCRAPPRNLTMASHTALMPLHAPEMIAFAAFQTVSTRVR